jgi:hypothetical protein
MVAYVLITWAIVLVSDILTERLRGRELMA